MYRALRGGQKERRGGDPKSRGCARMEGCRSPGWQGAQVRLEKEEISLGGDKGKGL